MPVTAALLWALDGHGILMRAEWDIAQHLASGRLVQLLPQFDTPDADIYAVYPQALHALPRLRAFVGFIAEAFAQQRAGAASLGRLAATLAEGEGLFAHARAAEMRFR